MNKDEELKYDYLGYTIDISALMDGMTALGTSDELVSFKDYMTKKVKGETKTERGQAAYKIVNHLDRVINYLYKSNVSHGKKDFEERFDKLEEYFAKKQVGEPVDSDDDKFLAYYGSECEKKLMEAVNIAAGLRTDFEEYNALDGYKEFRDDDVMQEMFRKFEAVTNNLNGILDMVRVIDVQSRLSRVFYKGEEIRSNINGGLNRLKNATKESNTYLSWAYVENEIERDKEWLESEKQEEEKLKNDVTKKRYKDIYELSVQKNGKMREKIEAIDLDIEELKGHIENEKIALTPGAGLDALQKEENSLLKDKKEFGVRLKSMEKTLAEKTRKRKAAEQNFKAAKEKQVFKNLGDEKQVKDLFKKRLTHRKWEMTKRLFDEFLDRYGNQGHVISVLFASSDQIENYAKLFNSNDKFRAEIIEAKERFREIAHWCPNEELFDNKSNFFLGQKGKPMVDFIKDVKKVIEDNEKSSFDAYKDNPSHVLEMYIKDALNSLETMEKKHPSEYEKNAIEAYKNMEEYKDLSVAEKVKMYKESVMEASRKNLDTYLAMRDEEKGINFNEIDQLIEIQMEGEKKIATLKKEEGRASDEVERIKDVINDIETSIAEGRQTAFDRYSPSKKNLETELRKKHIKKEEFDAFCENHALAFNEKTIGLIMEEAKKFLEDKSESALESLNKTRNNYLDEQSQYMSDMAEYSPVSLAEKIERAEHARKAREEKIAGLSSIQKSMHEVFGMYEKYKDVQNNIKQDFSDKLDNKIIFSGIRETVNHYLNMYGMAKEEGHTDTAKYEAIGRWLNVVLEVADDAPLETMVHAIGVLQTSVEVYLDEKKSQWRPFPSAQRVYRLKYANNIRDFCDSRISLLRNPAIRMTMTNKQAVKQAENILEADSGMKEEEFFNKCPKSLNGNPIKEKGSVVFDLLQRDPRLSDEEYEKQKQRESRKKEGIENEAMGQNENLFQDMQINLSEPGESWQEQRSETRKMLMDI